MHCNHKILIYQINRGGGGGVGPLQGGEGGANLGQKQRYVTFE